MSFVGYVVAGYATVFGVLAVYTIWLLARGRALARRVPAEELPWT